jgi:hypothetical protein
VFQDKTNWDEFTNWFLRNSSEEQRKEFMPLLKELKTLEETRHLRRGGIAPSLSLDE